MILCHSQITKSPRIRSWAKKSLLSESQIFDTKSNAEKYIEPENKKHSDNNDRFYRIVPFKIGVQLHNIDKT